jgi:hypothetical protein
VALKAPDRAVSVLSGAKSILTIHQPKHWCRKVALPEQACDFGETRSFAKSASNAFTVLKVGQVIPNFSHMQEFF